MAPYTNIPLSPAELSYLHTSLSLHPPIRPDARSPTQFRPLVAETDILPSANGSARICFADGTEAVVGVKSEVEKTKQQQQQQQQQPLNGENAGEGGGGGGVLELGRGRDADMGDAVHDEEEDEDGRPRAAKSGRNEWLAISIEIPGMRDDDPLPVFLSAMLTEALLADGALKDRLVLNVRFHWRLYIDILLLSPPLSYPLPLLSLTTHLALLSTRLPALVSTNDEDPLFNDDWEASTYLYPRRRSSSHGDSGNLAAMTRSSKPPITLLVMSVGDTVLFDPSREELAVADAVLAISVAPTASGGSGSGSSPSSETEAGLKILALRTVDAPSRLTAGGVPDALNTTLRTSGSASGSGNGAATMPTADALALRERDQGQTVWRAPRGGVKRSVVTKMIKMVVEKGGVGQEVMDGLAGVET